MLTGDEPRDAQAVPNVLHPVRSLGVQRHRTVCGGSSLWWDLDCVH